MKKSIGFYLTAAATVIVVLSLVFYAVSGTIMPYVLILNILAIVSGAAYVALYNKLGGNSFFPFLISTAAVLIIAAFAFSLITEVELLGYLVSGLRQWSDIQFWAFFSVAAIVSWILLLVASFLQPKVIKN